MDSCRGESNVLEVYLDGVLTPKDAEASQNLKSGSVIEEMKGLFLGCWTYYWYCMRGAIDEFRMWNTTRNASEIKNNMNRKIQNPKEEKNLYVYYDFNEIYKGNEINDLSSNDFLLKSGACSNQTDYYAGYGGCVGNFDNVSVLDYYPTPKWSDAYLDDIVYNLSMLENSNKTIKLNGTDLDGDEISLIFNRNPEFFDVYYNSSILQQGRTLNSPNYFPGTLLNQWIVDVRLKLDYAGVPLEYFSYYLNDGLIHSKETRIYLYVYCLEGRYLKGNKCVPCEPGSFANETGTIHCLLCERGYYQSNHSSTTCEICPHGYTTYEFGAAFCVFDFQ